MSTTDPQDLIERSSLGTPEASRRRARTPPDDVDRILNRSSELLAVLCEEAVRRVRSEADRALQERVYANYAPAVLAFVRMRLGNAAMAEDVTQAVFMHYWATRKNFDPNPGSPLGYLLVLARWRCVDLIRSEASAREPEDHAAAELYVCERCEEKHAAGEHRVVTDLESAELRVLWELFAGRDVQDIRKQLNLRGTSSSRSAVQQQLDDIRAIRALLAPSEDPEPLLKPPQK